MGAVYAPTSKQQQSIPDIVPMRRGRLNATPANQASARNPAPSPVLVTKGDPFAALDSKVVTQNADELSARFPTLDQFSILHDQGAQFSFEDARGGVETSAPTSPEQQKPKDLSQSLTERLADDAFASPPATAKALPQTSANATTAAVAASKKLPAVGISKSSSDPVRPKNLPKIGPNASPNRLAQPALKSSQQFSDISRASAIISSTPELQAISAQRQQHDTAIPAPKPKMVSTGTMTSPPPTPPPLSSSVDNPNRPQYKVFKFPNADQQARSSSLSRKPFPDVTASSAVSLNPSSSPQLRQQTQTARARAVFGSRQSLDGGRPSTDSLNASKSLPLQPRPTSTNLESSLDYLRNSEDNGGFRSSIDGRPARSPGDSPSKYDSGDSTAASGSYQPDAGTNKGDETKSVPSSETDIGYMRAAEEAEDRRERSNSKPAGGKRSSMTALSGTKNILVGKFGDAFKRFETRAGGSSNNTASVLSPSRTPSPLKQIDRYNNVDIDSNLEVDYKAESQNKKDIPEITDDMSPEVRRDIERRRLSMEDRRVAAAGVEYRQRIARVDTGSTVSRTPTGSHTGSGNSNSAPPSIPLPKIMPKSIGGVSRAVSIQNRVQNLLNEAQSSSPVSRTSQGYGHYADDSSFTSGSTLDSSSRSTVVPSTIVDSASSVGRGSFDERPDMRWKPDIGGQPETQRSVLPPKPTAKPKPLHLNKPLPSIGKNQSHSVSARSGSPTVDQAPLRPLKSRGLLPDEGGASASQTLLMAADLPNQPVLEGMTLQDRDDYIRDFTRRFPSLTAIEMVERDLSAEDGR